jgi:hypothetical protein
LFGAPTDDDDMPPGLSDYKMKNLSENGDDVEDSADDGSMSLYEDDDEGGKMQNLQDAAAKKTRESLAKSETRAVGCLRWFVMMVLLATAVAVTVTTFLYSQQVEEDQFRSEFESVAAMTLRSFVEAVEHKMAAMDSLATGVTSFALASGSNFPNVTVPDFEVKGSSIRTQTDSIFTFWLPLVTDETRVGYEAYCWPRQQQIFASYMAEEGLRQYQDFSFNISLPETEEAPQAEKKPDSRRQLHVAPPPIHETIHERIWGLDVSYWNRGSSFFCPHGLP